MCLSVLWRLHGSVVQATAYNYDPAGDGHVTTAQPLLTVAQLTTLATDQVLRFWASRNSSRQRCSVSAVTVSSTSPCAAASARNSSTRRSRPRA
jgi:hypothetical protein